MITRLLTPLVAALLSVGCATLEPPLPEATPAVVTEWPIPPTTGTPVASSGANAVPTADIGWRDFLADPRLQEVVALALQNNRDLRTAVLNVERSRAQYGIQRADRLPTLGASAALHRAGGNPALPPEQYSVGLGVTGFEVDLFGRVRNLSDSALQQFFAQEQARRSAQISLIAEVANAWLMLAADRELLQSAQATLANRVASLELAGKRLDAGGASRLEVNQAQAEAETARADVASYAARVEQDVHALNLLAGAPLDERLLPERLDVAASGLAPLPAALPSQVLLRRPDVLQTEHRLRAANANIGAARAAFFPSITLTSSIGSASTELSGLFGSGSSLWSFVPQINLPIFQAGRLQGQLGVAQADRDIALAQYEQAIQTGFREVADALTLTRRLAERRRAQEALVDAATQANELSQTRYRAGRDSYLVVLDTQRTLYGAQQALIDTRRAEQANRVLLYKVLGGGWKETSG